jgi:hypothetical protein
MERARSRGQTSAFSRDITLTTKRKDTVNSFGRTGGNIRVSGAMGSKTASERSPTSTGSQGWESGRMEFEFHGWKRYKCKNPFSMRFDQFWRGNAVFVVPGSLKMKYASPTPEAYRFSFASTAQRESITPRKISLSSNSRLSIVFDSETTCDKNSRKRVPKESQQVSKRLRGSGRHTIRHY